MKTLIRTLLVLLPAIILMPACKKDECVQVRTFTGQKAVYMSYDELRSSFRVLPPQPLEKPGKIFHAGAYIYINDLYKGIHIINNVNPESPRKVAFLSIPGNVDIAAHGTMLYADSYIDLLAIDISVPEQAKVTGRVKDVFPYNTLGAHDADPEKGVVIETVEDEITLEEPCGLPEREINFIDVQPVAADPNARSGEVSGGMAGSMSRFTIAGGYLYAVGINKMKLFNLANPSQPSAAATVSVGPDIETIFPAEDKLFIGSESGMYIYDNSNPANPALLSVYEHVQACDPVVVDGNYAYVTLRTGNNCGGFVNALQVIDITDPRSPTMISQHELSNPYGLGKWGKVLFVCDGSAGLKMFEMTDPTAQTITLMQEVNLLQTYDVIVTGSLAMVSSPSGFYQYSYTQDFDINQLSYIPID